ncbi:hypothetical protein LXL04_019382 [Taraxacum kok-saghyz]
MTEEKCHLIQRFKGVDVKEAVLVDRNGYHKHTLKTSAVCGPHLQSSAVEEVDQTSAVCKKKTVCFLTPQIDEQHLRCRNKQPQEVGLQSTDRRSAGFGADGWHRGYWPFGRGPGRRLWQVAIDAKLFRDGEEKGGRRRQWQRLRQSSMMANSTDCSSKKKSERAAAKGGSIEDEEKVSDDDENHGVSDRGVRRKAMRKREDSSCCGRSQFRDRKEANSDVFGRKIEAESELKSETAS